MYIVMGLSSRIWSTYLLNSYLFHAEYFVLDLLQSFQASYFDSANNTIGRHLFVSYFCGTVIKKMSQSKAT